MVNYAIASTWGALNRPDVLEGNDLGALIDQATDFFTRGTGSVASVWITLDTPDEERPHWEPPRHPDHTPLLADGFYLLEIREEGAPTNRSKGRARRFVHARGHVNPRAVRDAETAITAVERAQRDLARAMHEWEQVRTAIPAEMAERMQERIRT